MKTRHIPRHVTVGSYCKPELFSVITQRTSTTMVENGPLAKWSVNVMIDTKLKCKVSHIMLSQLSYGSRTRHKVLLLIHVSIYYSLDCIKVQYMADFLILHRDIRVLVLLAEEHMV